jgi:hypothetical protein
MHVTPRAQAGVTDPHGRGASAAMQFSVAASATASSRWPTPSGPTSSHAWDRRSSATRRAATLPLRARHRPPRRPQSARQGRDRRSATPLTRRSGSGASASATSATMRAVDARRRQPPVEQQPAVRLGVGTPVVGLTDRGRGSPRPRPRAGRGPSSPGAAQPLVDRDVEQHDQVGDDLTGRPQVQLLDAPLAEVRPAPW